MTPAQRRALHHFYDLVWTEAIRQGRIPKAEPATLQTSGLMENRYALDPQPQFTTPASA